jgi:hypothetical protein
MTEKEKEDLLRMKAEEIREHLAEWAERRTLLRAGELLVFQLAIKSIPVEVQAPRPVMIPIAPDEILDMKTWDFFTSERLEESGFPTKFNLSVIGKLWPKESYMRKHNKVHPGLAGSSSHDVTTIRELVALGRRGLRGRARGFGNHILGVIQKVLEDAGVTLVE